MRTNVNEIRLSARLFAVTVAFTNEGENLVLKARLGWQVSW
jgi:cytochrome c